MKNYNEIMRGLREDNDLKQIDIANVIGTSQQHYSSYENGVYELPIRALATLADFYKVSADYIMGRTKCKEGVDGLNKKICPDYTIGAVITDILSLNEKNREAVIEYISLLKLKENS